MMYRKMCLKSTLLQISKRRGVNSFSSAYFEVKLWRLKILA